MTCESSQDSLYCQRDAAFWARYGEMARSVKGQARAAAYLREVINHRRPHQAEH